MQINNNIAWKQYETKGILATLRNYPYEYGKKIMVSHNGKYEGLAVIEAVRTDLYTMQEYHKFVKNSGFKTEKEWFETAKKLNNGRTPKRIVQIRRVGKKWLEKLK